MSVCDIEGAAKAIENLYATLDSKKDKQAVKALTNLKDYIQGNREAMIRASSFAGAGAINIQDPTRKFLNEVPKDKPSASKIPPGPAPTQAPPETPTLNRFVIGETEKDVPLEELLELVGDMAAYSNYSRGMETSASEKVYLDSITDILKLHTAGQGRTINVKIVNELPEKEIANSETGVKEVRAPLGSYNLKSNTLTLAVSPDHSKLSPAAVKIGLGKVALHEIVHSMSVRTLHLDKALNDKVTVLRKQAIAVITKSTGKEPKYESGSPTYGLRNNAEFIAETITSYQLQKLLAGISSSKAESILNRIRNIFRSIMASIKRNAGVDENSYTLLDEALAVATDVIDRDNNLSAEELNALDMAMNGVKPTEEVVKEEPVEPTTKGYEFDGPNGKKFTTNIGQTSAINTMKKWHDSKVPNFLLQGRGGTGKTTVINVLLDELGISPMDVMFITPTNKATKVLADINATNKYKDSDHNTIASVLNIRPNDRGEFYPIKGAKETELGKVLIVDEGSMVHSKNYDALLMLANKYGTRIIFMGDHAQMPPMGDDRAPVKSVVFSDNTEATTNLNELMRQDKDSPIVTFTDRLITMVQYVENVLESDIGKIAKLKETNTFLDNQRFDGDFYNSKYNQETGEGMLVTDSGFRALLPHLKRDFQSNLKGTKFIHYNKYDNTKTVDNTKLIRREIYGNHANEELFIKGEPLVLNAPHYPIESEFMEDGGRPELLDNAEEFTVVSSVKDKQKVTYYVQGKEQQTEEEIDIHRIVASNDITGELHTFVRPVDSSPGAINRIVAKEAPKLLKTFGYPHKENQLRSYLGSTLSHSYIINGHKAQGSSYENVYVDIGNIMYSKADDNAKVKSMYVGGSRPKKRLIVIDSSTKSKVINGADMNKVPVVSPLVGVDSSVANDVVREADKCIGDV